MSKLKISDQLVVHVLPSKFLNKLIVGLGSVSEPGVVPLLEVLLLERVELA